MINYGFKQERHKTLHSNDAGDSSLTYSIDQSVLTSLVYHLEPLRYKLDKQLTVLNFEDADGVKQETTAQLIIQYHHFRLLCLEKLK